MSTINSDNQIKNNMVHLQSEMVYKPIMDPNELLRVMDNAKAEMRARLIQAATQWIMENDCYFVLERGLTEEKLTCSVFLGSSKDVYESVFQDIMWQLEEHKKEDDEKGKRVQ